MKEEIEDRIHDTPEQTRMTPRQWLENYWYHYKWPTLSGALFFFVILISCVQCMSRVDPDVFLMYSGPKVLTFDEITALKTSVVDLMDEDYNGDGRKSCEYLENIVIFDGDYTVKDEAGDDVTVISQTEQVQNYVTRVIAGDAQIYLASPEVYAELRKQNVLTPLSEIYGEMPGASYDSAAFTLGELELARYPGFSSLPADTLLCLRVPRTLVANTSQAQAEHEWASAVFRSLVAAKAPPEES